MIRYSWMVAKRPAQANEGVPPKSTSATRSRRARCARANDAAARAGASSRVPLRAPSPPLLESVRRRRHVAQRLPGGRSVTYKALRRACSAPVDLAHTGPRAAERPNVGELDPGAAHRSHVGLRGTGCVRSERVPARAAAARSGRLARSPARRAALAVSLSAQSMSTRLDRDRTDGACAPHRSGAGSRRTQDVTLQPRARRTGQRPIGIERSPIRPRSDRPGRARQGTVA